VARIRILSHKESPAYQLNKRDKKITNVIASLSGSMLEQDRSVPSLALALRVEQAFSLPVDDILRLESAE